MSSSAVFARIRRTLDGGAVRRIREGARFAGVLRVAISLGLVCVSAGCYELRPSMQIEPKADAEFKLELTDAARVAVAEKLGVAVKDVTGRVVRRDGDDVVLAVREVTYLTGDILTMKGEEVHFNRQQLSSANERTFSMGKSLLAAGVVAVAVGFLLGSKGLLGSGGSSGDGNCTGPGCGATSSLHP